MPDVLGGVKARIDDALEAVLWRVIAAAAAGAGLLFILIALFIGLAARYGALTACLALGLLFAVFSATAAIGFALAGHRPHKPLSANIRRAHGIFTEASNRGRDAATALRDVAGTLSDTFKKAARRRPLATVGLALAAGFIFGATRRR